MSILNTLKILLGLSEKPVKVKSYKEVLAEKVLESLYNEPEKWTIEFYQCASYKNESATFTLQRLGNTWHIVGGSGFHESYTGYFNRCYEGLERFTKEQELLKKEKRQEEFAKALLNQMKGGEL